MQLNRTIEDRSVQQEKLLELQKAADTVQVELRSVQAELLPLDVEVDKLTYLNLGLCEMTGDS